MSLHISVSRQHWLAMLEHVASEAPLEACGLLAGREAVALHHYALENELRSPTRFRIAPPAQLEAFKEMEDAGLSLLAIYHSHPQGPSHPSTTDIAEAFYHEAFHLIWSRAQEQWQCRAFRIGADGAVEVKLHIIEGQATSP